jgi:hypothetical protein
VTAGLVTAGLGGRNLGGWSPPPRRCFAGPGL